MHATTAVAGKSEMLDHLLTASALYFFGEKLLAVRMLGLKWMFMLPHANLTLDTAVGLRHASAA